MTSRVRDGAFSSHCGLEWEDACRNFHDTKRTVRTASLMQVREPVHRRAIGNWQRYAETSRTARRGIGCGSSRCDGPGLIGG